MALSNTIRASTILSCLNSQIHSLPCLYFIAFYPSSVEWTSHLLPPGKLLLIFQNPALWHLGRKYPQLLHQIKKKFSSSELHLCLYISSLLILYSVCICLFMRLGAPWRQELYFTGFSNDSQFSTWKVLSAWKLFIEWVNESRDCNIQSFKVLVCWNTLSWCFIYLLFLLSVHLIPHNLLHNTFCSHHFNKMA